MLKASVVIAFCFLAVAYGQETPRPPSPCEEDRARRLNATVTDTPLHLIPRCDPNGDYSALQCFTSNNWCVCYRRNGENINTPSKNTKACDCIRQRDDARSQPGTHVPRCTREGYYQPKQCLKDECWCVDKDGKILTDPKVGDVKC